jgi:AraC family transcriptional regulator
MNHKAGHAEPAVSQRYHPGSTARDELKRLVTGRAQSDVTAAWRQSPVVADCTTRSPRVVAARWRSLENQFLEVQALTAESSHLLCIALRKMDIRLAMSGRLIKEGVVTPGTLHLTMPGVLAECVFKGPYDALHLHIANGLIAECGSALQVDPGDIPTDTEPYRDPVIEGLGMNLLEADQQGAVLGPLYTDCLGTAIVARLLAARGGATNRELRGVTELPKWRLRRALDYVEEHLDEPIRLADLAATTGVSRMHFAAQFRAATGLRPHEYLLRRRVERAQVLLSRNVPTVNVALEVGFQSQAHFTNVFKRFVGQPPHTWWRLRCDTSAPLPGQISSAA